MGTLFSTLEDLDFADDLALVSHTHQHMQERTTRLSIIVCTTSRPKDQPEEDRSDDAECSKPLACQSKQRRSSNN